MEYSENILRIGLKGTNINADEIPSSNLVFLIDVSGSMQGVNKLQLAKKSLKILTKNLHADDRVSIVVYAGAAGVVLPSTSGDNKQVITESLQNLNAGGSTAGGEGILLAYKIASENFIEHGNNRVVLLTDGDFNVGVSSTDELVHLIETQRESGVFLTICGFGMGNYKDYRMEELSNCGNGNYFYIDNLLEANRVFDTDLTSNIFTVAKDVKIQIEFNPAQVNGYRLLGYENRVLKSEEFNDDKKDAGEIGPGHTITALYEIIPANANSDLTQIDQLKYQKPKLISSEDLATIKFRYKRPIEDHSNLITHEVEQILTPFNQSAENTRFAASVASFGMLLRNSAYKGSGSFEQVLSIAESSMSHDPFDYRKEFIGLVKMAAVIEKTN